MNELQRRIILRYYRKVPTRNWDIDDYYYVSDSDRLRSSRHEIIIMFQVKHIKKEN